MFTFLQNALMEGRKFKLSKNYICAKKHVVQFLQVSIRLTATKTDNDVISHECSLLDELRGLLDGTSNATPTG